MSVVSVHHPSDFRTRERNVSGCSRRSERSCSEESLHRCSSLRELSSTEELHRLHLKNGANGQQYHDSTCLTIESLKTHLNSCFTCGVSWHKDHVSLDCHECGGYSLRRPCPECDGKCEAEWKRDLAMSHSLRKAYWEGQCNLSPTASSGCGYEEESRLCESMEKNL